MQNVAKSLSLLAIAFLLIFITSCGKDDENENAAPDPNTFAFSFTANDTTYTCLEASISKTFTPSPFGTAYLELNGTTTTGEAIGMTFNHQQVGENLIQSFIHLRFRKGNHRKACGSGKITVTSINSDAKRITGTFYGDGTNLKIRNGIFTYLGY